MRLSIGLLVGLLLISPLSAYKAQAGEYTDQLSSCLVESSSGEEKLTLVKWMFMAMSLHPAVNDLAEISASDRDTSNKAMADLMVRLLTEKCNEQTTVAIKFEGPIALQTSFSVLGQVAATALFADPAVAAGLAGLDRHLDVGKINQSLGIGQ